MKKIIVILSLLLQMVSVGSFAQSLVSGSLLPLKNEKTLRLEIEFKNIHGMNEESFGDYERDWFRDKKEVYAKLLVNANEILNERLLLVKDAECKFTVKVIVNHISLKGDYSCEISIIDNEIESEIAKIEGVSASGGRFGSKLNLIKDGAEHTGKELGIILRKLIKKAK